MEFENEKKNEEMSAEQQSTNNSQDGGYQGYRPGRSPRPRIHQTVRPYNQGGYHQNQNQEEGGFRPEGFGAGLQGGTPQRAYRPRNNYNQEGGYQPRQQGYRPRPQYGQQEGGYQPRQQGYRPRPQYGQQEGGYQPRQQEGGYQPRQQGYRPRHMDSRKVVISPVEAISLVRAAISLASRATIPIMVENLTEHPMVTHIRRSNMVRTIPMPSTQ